MSNRDLAKIEESFRELIIEQCRFCGFDKFLEENPSFEFPKITTELLGWGNGRHITIPGLFGGFDYFLEKAEGKFVLYVEQSSRMDYSSDSYMDFEITESRSRVLEREERKAVQEKFRKIAKNVRQEHLRRMEEARKKYKSS